MASSSIEEGPDKQYPLVSVLILNWNGEEFLGECLDSVLKTTYSRVEVVVVDNCSSDGSLEIISRYSSVKLVANDRNLGYAGGNNVGFRHCSGDYIVTLNNDITVDPDWLSEPVKTLMENPDIGIVCCRQMSYHRPEFVDGLYHKLNRDLTFGVFGAGSPLDSDPRFLEEGYVLSVNGGSSVVRKKMLEEIGGYDERFFAYYDEVDLCMKAFIHGWSAYYCPGAVVFHLGSASFTKTGIFTYFLRERNRIWFLYKYFPLRMIIAGLPSLFLMELRVIRVMGFKLGRPDKYLQARYEAFRSLPAYRRLRKENLKLLKRRIPLFKRFSRCRLLTAEEFAEYRHQSEC